MLANQLCWHFGLGQPMQLGQLKRRQFIKLLGGAAAWPLAARGQQMATLSKIGILGSGTPSSEGQWYGAFVERLRELGWIEGRTISFEYRWAEGRIDRYADIAAEFVRIKADVIVTAGSGPVAAAKRATSVIPIVFAAAADPVGTGLVASLPRPGGNVTGLSIQGPEITGKRLGLLREVVPGVRRLVIMGNPDTPGAALEMREMQAKANAVGLEAAVSEIRRAEDIATAFEALKGRADALYVTPDPLMSTLRIRINALALAARLPTLHTLRDEAKAGGLISYGPNFTDLFRRAAHLADKILRGANPADIPVEQPTKFELVLNLKTARMLGLEIPDHLLALADEVID
jgi:ABC-type uncharacterized transport system substrate-binding protein